jgi:hypothetical protein
MSDRYNDEATSDITLCFGENEKVHAHKIILKAASGVWNQAFNSKLPISASDKYHIEGHSNVVIHAMLRHVYGMPLDAKPIDIPKEGRIDYLFDVFDIANEYQIPSLGEAVTERVVQLMDASRIKPARINGSVAGNYTGVDEGKRKFCAVISRTAELYMGNNVADKSLMNGVLDACFDRVKEIVWLEDELKLSSLIEKHDPFCGRLLKLFLPNLQQRGSSFE